jgi:hypothetical protein
MDILLMILYFVLMAGVLIGSLTLLKRFVFSKIRINKYIPLGIAVVGFLFQLFLKPDNVYISIGITAVIVLFFSWFWDINQTGGPKKSNEKKIIVKPKAKPNRVKKNK